jgi:hypothetical protein
VLAATQKLFFDYLRVVIDDNQIPSAVNNDRRYLALELAERIAELHFILTRGHELEALISELSHLREVNGPSFESESEERARIELRVLTEGFYYCAARARAVARNTKFPLPGLASFECKGVRDVRNKLLEHPEGSDSQVFVVSFGRGGSDGPVIKPLRPVGQENIFPDAGLFRNAEEFKVNLERLLMRALAERGT